MLQIHDELVFEVEDAVFDDFVPVIIDCMTNCVEGFSVPLELSMYAP
jgi:DNA polymerase I-like protein with 3'-5' exonuclease and polymerase domains